MKKEFNLSDEFSVEELEIRLEMTARAWVGPCDNPEHCHPEQ